MPGVGFNTPFIQDANTVFVVKNICENRKTIRIFRCPILWNQSKNLMSVPEVSEADIRHSLLKGELFDRIKRGEITVIESNIDLLQFDLTQRQFLINAGITNGLNTISSAENIVSQSYTVGSIQNISSINDQILPLSTYHRFTSSGNITLVSEPIISWDGISAGQILILHNVGAPAAGHLIFSKGNGFGLSLSSGTKRIDEGGTMMLIYDGSIWTEMTHMQATSV